MSKHLITFILSVAAVFAPVQAVVITTAVLVIMDLITGVWASITRKEPITSAGFRRTVTKLAVYQVAVLLGFLTQTYLTGPLIPVSSIISSFIGLTELKSVTENLNDISGGSLLKVLVEKLGSINQKSE